MEGATTTTMTPYMNGADSAGPVRASRRVGAIGRASLRATEITRKSSVAGWSRRWTSGSDPGSDGIVDSGERDEAVAQRRGGGACQAGQLERAARHAGGVDDDAGQPEPPVDRAASS